MRQQFADLPRCLKVYVAAIVLGSVIVSSWAVRYSHPQIVLWLIAIFTAAAVVDPIPFPYGGILHPIGGIAQFAALLWQPQDILLGVEFGCLLGLLVLKKSERWKAVINACGWGIGALAAAMVAQGVLTPTPNGLSVLLATLAAVASRHVVNRIIFSGYRCLRFGYPFLSHVLESLVAVMPEELYCAPLIAILAGAAIVLKTTTWSLVLTAAYLVVLPVPSRRRGRRRWSDPDDEIVDHALHEAQLRDQSSLCSARGSRANRVWVEPAVAECAIAQRGMLLGAHILAVAELYDNLCGDVSFVKHAGRGGVARQELIASAGVPNDSRIISTLLKAALDLGFDAPHEPSLDG